MFPFWFSNFRLFFAKLVKGNLFAAIGTWISNPLTYIPLYSFNYKVGSIVLKTSQNDLAEKSLVVNDLFRQGSIFSIRLILGSSLVGIILGFICGFIVFWIYKIKKNSY